MHEIALDGNIYYTNNGFFEKGKNNCRSKALQHGSEIDYSHGKRLLLQTIPAIKAALDVILDNPEYVSDIYENPSLLDDILKINNV